MDQEVLREATKHITFVIAVSFLTRVPIAKAYSELVVGEIRLKGNKTFLCPTVEGIDEHVVICFRLHAFP